MNHDYQLDWSELSRRGRHYPDPSVDYVAEVCVTPGHGLHTRSDALEAERYPHLFTLHIEAMTLRVRPQGQMELSL